MSIERPTLRKNLIQFSMLAFGLWITAYLLYPRVVLELYGKHIPPTWSSDLGGMNLKEVHEKLGPPQDDVSAKDYQNWIEHHWWGVKMLKIISNDCCRATAKPNTVIYVVFVNGRYDPVYRKIIFKSVDSREGPGISGE